MNYRPVYENLDTSFVNLSALVRYLRRRQFVGRLRLELNSYEADILFVEDNIIKIREHDKIAGRIAEGEEALQRLLIRAREPGGAIHVYQTIGKAEPVKAASVPVDSPAIQTDSVQKTEQKPVQPETVTELSKTSIPQPKQLISNGTAIKTVQPAEVSPKPLPKPNLPNFPFELKNSVEEKARQNRIDPQEWQMILNLTAELLGTIDKTLSEAKLDFKAAFTKSRLQISPDYPFLNPTADVFEYNNGKIAMREQVAAKLYAAGINEALRPILEKLGANPKFAEIYRTTIQRILALINQRKPLYDKYFITPQLQKIIGA